MLKIRKEQMQTLNELMFCKFENFMVSHLRRFYTETCLDLGEEGIREEVRYGIEHAKTYNIVDERNVCKYIDVMFAFGRDFDNDPDLPWAGEILRDDAIGSPVERMDILCRTAIDKMQG